jgi:hypothetical protein
LRKVEWLLIEIQLDGFTFVIPGERVGFRLGRDTIALLDIRVARYFH